MFSAEYTRLKNELHDAELSENERRYLVSLVILRIAFAQPNTTPTTIAGATLTSPSSSSSSSSVHTDVRHLVDLEVSKIKQESAMKIQTQEAKIQTQEARIRTLEKEIKRLRQEVPPSRSTNYLSPTVNSFNRSILSSSPIRHVMTPMKRALRISKDYSQGKRKYLNYNKIAQTLTRTQRLERRRKELEGDSDTSRISEMSDEESIRQPASPTPDSPQKDLRPKKIRLQKSNSQPPIDNTRTTLGEDDLNSIGYYQDANFTDVSPVRQSSGATDPVAVTETVEPKKKRNIFEIE